jgi:hypothetical protein
LLFQWPYLPHLNAYFSADGSLLQDLDKQKGGESAKMRVVQAMEVSVGLSISPSKSSSYILVFAPFFKPSIATEPCSTSLPRRLN